MRKLFPVLMVILLVIGLVITGCGPKAADTGADQPSGDNAPYKIGLMSSISGPVGYLGADVVDAAKLEVEKINAAGGVNGHPIELVIADDAFDSSKAVTQFNKLVQQDEVLAVFGYVGTAFEPAIRPLAEKYQVSTLKNVMTGPEMRARNDKYTFTMPPSEIIDSLCWVDMCKENNFTSVIAILTNDNISGPLVQQFTKDAAAAGITVTALPDQVNTDTVDATPQISKLKELITQTKAQAIVTTVWPPQIPVILKTMSSMGLNLPLYPLPWAAADSLLQMGGEELEGLTTPGLKAAAGDQLPDSDTQKAQIVDFKKRYEAATKRNISEIASYTYDSIHIIANALAKSGPDRVRLRDAIENETKNYVGITGTYTFSATDHEGLTPDSLGVYTIKDHQLVYKRAINK